MKWVIFFLLFSFSLQADLWQERRDQFQKYGYVWIKNFYSPEQVLLLKKWAEEIDGSARAILALSQNTGFSLEKLVQAIPGALIVVPEAKNPLQVCRSEDLLTCLPDLNHFITGTATSYLSALLEEPYVAFKDKINFKWPGGGAFSPHQDFPAFSFLGPREHITAMICIDSATIENGCLYIAKNWREDFVDTPEVDPQQLEIGRAVLPYIQGGSNHGSIQPEFCEKITWTPLETSPGDVVFFTSYVPHYSEPNHSEHSRRAMFITYNRLRDGDHKMAYYHMKRADPGNPTFHFGTPTKGRD